MGTMGRPPAGPKLVDRLDGSESARTRTRLILETIAGTKTIAEAAAELGIGETRFLDLRTAALASMVAANEPRPAGRPPTPEPTEAEQQVAELSAQVRQLTIELEAARIRTEIALVMPHVLKSQDPKKNNGRNSTRR